MLSRRSFFAAVPALALPAVASAAPGAAPGPRTLLVAGQSLAVPYRLPFMQDAFNEGAGSPWEFLVVARGGTSAAKWPGGRPDDYCWTVDGANGPVLDQAIARIKLSRVQPTAMLWAQGQADGGAWDPAIHTQSGFVTTYIRTVLGITVSLRRAAAGDDWRSIPCMIQTIGWVRDLATGGNVPSPGFELIRHAQTTMLATYAETYNLRPGPVQTPWAKLKDPVHPTDEENAKLARMCGKLVRQIM